MMDFHLSVLIILRWTHIVSAILWVGIAFFLNLVLSPAVKKMDSSLRPRVLPDILDRAMFWLRWGALFTYVTGWVYLIYKCYGASNVGFHGENGLGHTTWGQWVSVGVVIGTVLVINVWYVIWPAQKKIIRWMRAGETPAQMPAVAANADKASKINLYLSIPLIFTMAAASHLPIMNSWIVAAMLLVGFALAAHLFMIANRIFRAAVVLALVFASVFGAQDADAANVKKKFDGKALYAQHCARCHGDLGTGDGPAHTMQRPWPRDFTTGEYKFRSTPIGTLPTLRDVERVIANGIPRTSMSGYKKWLSAEEIEAVARYVLEFSKNSGVPAAADGGIQIPQELADRPALKAGAKPFAADRLARGKQAFAVNCASCHGADGRGLGDLAGQLRDKDGFWIAPADLTDALGYGGGSRAADVYRTLTTGIAGSSMPVFDTILDEATRVDVAAYVESLQVEPAQRTLVSREAWNHALPSKVRGEYMTRAMSCALCHNSYDATGAYYPKPYLAGGVAITIPGLGVFPTRNITSHPTDGLGRWTEEEIARVITTGHAPNRRIEAFSMPWVYFSHLTEQDARDVAAYVKSLKPIENQVPARKYDPIWKRLWTRLKQVTRLELGRLEYPPFNVGSRQSEGERLDAEHERAGRLRARRLRSEGGQ